MVYLQLRITHSQADNSASDTPVGMTHQHANLLIKHARRFIIGADPSHCEITVGHEVLDDKGRDMGKPHYHLHASFEPPDLKDPLRTLREQLKRKALALETQLKGNKIYSLSLVPEPKDYERWIRYPLKETPIIILCHGFSELQLQTMHRDAHIEQKRSIEINLINEAKIADKITWKDKLFKHLDAQLQPGAQDHQIIWIAILNYYKDQGKVISFPTISGYTILYQLKIETISPEQCYDMRSNPY